MTDPRAKIGAELPPPVQDPEPVGGQADARSPSGAPDHSTRVGELFEAHNRALLRFLSCRLRSAQEAKEVAQEAYVRMLQLDAPDGIGYLRAFLFKTAANLAADRMKSMARRGRVDRLEFFDISDCEPSPETGVSAAQELAVVMKICEQLPARCRYAFVMHRFQGHTIPEVAASMNLSVRMVQLYVERALAFCRERLIEENQGQRSVRGGSQ